MKVEYYGQIIAAIVADTDDTASLASNKVAVTYQDLPPVMTIDEAVSIQQYFKTPETFVRGYPDDGFSQCDVTVTGETHTGGQQHVYMETQSMIAIPDTEDDGMEIWCSTQDRMCLQVFIS